MIVLLTSLAAPLMANPNVFQRHPTASGIAVAVATHHMLKVSAARKKMMGEHLNFAERHPTMTAIAAGVVTHHYLKKSVHH